MYNFFVEKYNQDHNKVDGISLKDIPNPDYFDKFYPF